jgi:hypothetical protein
MFFEKTDTNHKSKTELQIAIEKKAKSLMKDLIHNIVADFLASKQYLSQELLVSYRNKLIDIAAERCRLEGYVRDRTYDSLPYIQSMKYQFINDLDVELTPGIIKKLKQDILIESALDQNEITEDELSSIVVDLYGHGESNSTVCAIQ